MGVGRAHAQKAPPTRGPDTCMLCLTTLNSKYRMLVGCTVGNAMITLPDDAHVHEFTTLSPELPSTYTRGVEITIPPPTHARCPEEHKQTSQWVKRRGDAISASIDDHTTHAIRTGRKRLSESNSRLLRCRTPIKLDLEICSIS